MTLKEFATELSALKDEAKQLFGVEEYDYAHKKEYNPGWQYHFEHMILSNDPVKYLKDHSKGEQ